MKENAKRIIKELMTPNTQMNMIVTNDSSAICSIISELNDKSIIIEHERLLSDDLIDITDDKDVVVITGDCYNHNQYADIALSLRKNIIILLEYQNNALDFNKFISHPIYIQYICGSDNVYDIFSISANNFVLSCLKSRKRKCVYNNVSVGSISRATAHCLATNHEDKPTYIICNGFMISSLSDFKESVTLLLQEYNKSTPISTDVKFVESHNINDIMYVNDIIYVNIDKDNSEIPFEITQDMLNTGMRVNIIEAV